MKIISNKIKGFTLAEVLVTLAIIGVLAAILFPSILANYTERTLKAKRSAFIARMSQAMGELADQFGNYEDITCENSSSIYTCTDNATALKFISEGLSKTYKISSICDKDSLVACDIPDNITKEDGTVISLHTILKSFKDYENGGVKFEHSVAIPYKNLYPAAFITKNGESAVVFVNPNCTNKDDTNQAQESLMCVNMIYDLNGAKGKPNKVGEDIWYLTSFYSSSPNVVSPKVYDFDKVFWSEGTNSSGEKIKIHPAKTGLIKYQESADICAALGDNIALPSFEEAASILLNLPLFTDQVFFKEQTLASQGGYQSAVDLWTSTPCSPYKHKLAEVDFGADFNDDFCWEDDTTYHTTPTCVIED